MRNLDSLAMSQRRNYVKNMKCIHSRMASKLAGENWQNRWPALQLGTIRLATIRTALKLYIWN